MEVRPTIWRIWMRGCFFLTGGSYSRKRDVRMMSQRALIKTLIFQPKGWTIKDSSAGHLWGMLP